MYYVKINTTRFQFVTNFMHTKFGAQQIIKRKISSLKKADGKLINAELWRFYNGKNIFVKII